ncbi:heavy metal-binding domain-containing protein [Lutibacter flavus]|uniref:Heavy metal binding domain-containing protein n=1 Tax=Lutibacter flavus TaxID=691689 RepID=A0A238Z763_9FLAO|nr:heavy metal-binding domain-containing protein [Lutibacter flavus]SNR78761.1 hypothetical protein SAMN04488111_3087 [Lutibacter flavus]
MKKTILVLTAIFSFTVLFTACKETKKEEVKEEVKMENHDGHDHSKEEMASKDVYQCPMDCEKGKTYEGEGACPVCKMDLKVKSVDSDAMHAEGCKCKEAGECTCEGGKCECKAGVASNDMECTKCEPGTCECKA